MLNGSNQCYQKRTRKENGTELKWLQKNTKGWMETDKAVVWKKVSSRQLLEHARHTGMTDSTRFVIQENEIAS